MPTSVTVARFESSTSSREYLVKTDGVTLSCDCPRWRFKRRDEARSCRHVAQVEGDLRAMPEWSGQALGAILAAFHRTMQVGTGVSAALAGVRARLGPQQRPAAPPARDLADPAFTPPRRRREPQWTADPTAGAEPFRPAWLGGRRSIRLRDE